MQVKVAFARIALMPLGLALSACGGSDGGSGGGVASTPPPPATNASLAKLPVSQTFTNDAATSAAVFDLTSSTTTSGTASGSTLTIGYDAGSNTYTLSTQGRTQSFASADLSSSNAGQAVYKKSDGTNRDYLTLTAATFGGTGGPQYVGAGFWQRNVVSGKTQTTSFDSFTYGLDTPASAVPRIGQATMAAAVFGLTTAPGFEPQSFAGNGQFNLDFQRGIFSTSASVTETALVTGSTSEGGSEQLTASGTLSASNGTFSGLANYSGIHVDASGPLNGRLYGPVGQELGAVFSAVGGDGSAASGTIIGYTPANSMLSQINLALTNLVTDQLYYTLGEGLNLTQTTSGAAYYTSSSQYPDHEQLTQHPTGGLDVPSLGNLPPVQYVAADEVSGATNFTTYQKTVSGQTVTTEIYKPGSGNTELALTYTSFAHIFGGTVAATSPLQEYEIFGLPTADGLLNARTGTAHYSGIAYGAGGNSTTGATYVVTGTSAFDVNFSSQSLTGSLALNGASSAGAINFGAFTFTGAMARGQGVSAALNQGTTAVGYITPQFFGPLGEEIGGPFQVVVPAGAIGAGTAIAGVTAAKGG